MVTASLWSLWWIWMSGALALAILEIVVPGFVFLGFAIGAALAGFLLLIGFSATAPILMVVFAALSLIAWLVLRRMFRLPGEKSRKFRHDIND